MANLMLTLARILPYPLGRKKLRSCIQKKRVYIFMLVRVRFPFVCQASTRVALFGHGCGDWRGNSTGTHPRLYEAPCPGADAARTSAGCPRHDGDLDHENVDEPCVRGAGNSPRQPEQARYVFCFLYSRKHPKKTRYLKEQEKRKEEKLAAASRRKQVRMEEESCPGRPCSPLARLPRARLAKTEPGKGWNCFCLAGNGRDRQSGWW
jgi:hypothetical protein